MAEPCVFAWTQFKPEETEQQHVDYLILEVLRKTFKKLYSYT